jgi:hypothetical protein
MRPGDYLTPRAIGERDARDGTSARKSLMTLRSACDEFKDTKEMKPEIRETVKGSKRSCSFALVSKLYSRVIQRDLP